MIAATTLIPIIQKNSTIPRNAKISNHIKPPKKKKAIWVAVFIFQNLSAAITSPLAAASDLKPVTRNSLASTITTIQPGSIDCSV